EFFEDLVTSYQQEHDTGPGEVAAALAYLLQRERPLRAREKEKTKDKHRDEAKKKVTRPPTGSRPAKPGAPEKRSRKEKGARPSRQEEVPMETYRIEVGQEHGVEPKNIVGAIANEADLDSQYIGPIRIHEDHSLVDLPEGMPKDLYKHLRKVWVCGRQLQLSLVDEKGKPKARKAAKKPTGGKQSKPRKKR
ncbi:MAG: DbpA RNA binding domain-containing protein, partial [Pseudomonadota bacterium]